MLKRWPKLQEIVYLLLPMILTFALELSAGFVDTIMLGHYDPYHLAAVGIASSLWLPFGCFLIGMNFALTPLVTRHLHGRQIKLVPMYMSQAFGVCFTIGVAVSLIVAFALPFLVGYLTDHPTTQKLTIQYLQCFASAMPFLGAVVAYKALFSAAGRPNLPLLSATISVLINILLNYLLIYGKFGLPELGAVGAALASAIAMLVSFVFFMLYDRLLNPSPLFSSLKVKYLFRYGILLHVGLPAGCSYALEIILFSSIIWMISSFGDLAVGAGQIVLSYMTILFTPLMGISAVSAIVVAKSFANEGVDGVRVRMRIILLLGFCYTLSCLLFTQLFSAEIPFLFTSDTRVAALTSGMLLIASCYQVVDMVQTALTGALRGLRDTRVPMLAFTVSLFGVSLPLGFWLAHYSPWSEWLNVRSFHLGLGAGLSLLAVILLWRFTFVLQQKAKRERV